MSDIERSASRAEGAARTSGEGMGRSFTRASTEAQALGHQVSALGVPLASATRQQLEAAQAVGQLAQSFGQAGTATSGFARVLSGPWGAAATVAVTYLIDLAVRSRAVSTAVEDATERLRRNAEQTEANRQAQAIFANTLEGVRDAVQRNREALRQLEEGHGSEAQRVLETALTQQVYARSVQATTLALLRQRQAEAETLRSAPGTDEFGALRQRQAEDALRVQITALEEANNALVELDRQVRQALARRGVEIGESLSSPVERIRDRYDNPNTGLIALERRRLVAARATSAEIIRQTALLAQQRDAEIRAQQQRQSDARRRPRAAREPSDGVSRFRSRQQAIGVAGRELQGLGFRVSENEQFGGVRGRHTYAQHGQFAIDVNIGRGNIEANDPGMRERMDQAARSYQARGYRVLWNGRIYEPGGDGPGPIIPARNSRGQRVGQHREHLHLEAPESIVGRPTGTAGGLRQDLDEARRDTPLDPDTFRQHYEQLQDIAEITARPGGILALTPDQIANADALAADIEEMWRVANDMPSLADGLLPREDQERLERFQEDFQRDLVGGLIDAAVQGENLGDALVRAFQRAATELVTSGLLDLLSGRGLGNTLLGNLFGGGRVSIAGGMGSKVPGFATGGTMIIGGASGTDRNMLSLNGQPIARVSRGEHLNIVPPNAARPGPGSVTVIVNAQDAVLTHTVRGWIAQGMMEAAGAGASQGATAVTRNFTRARDRAIP